MHMGRSLVNNNNNNAGDLVEVSGGSDVSQRYVMHLFERDRVETGRRRGGCMATSRFVEEEPCGAKEKRDGEAYKKNKTTTRQ